MKFFKIFLCFVLICSVFCVSSFALSTSTYADLSSTSSTGQNLINLALNYDTFENSDFVIFQDGQYSYYIVWGDLTYNASSVSGSEIEYISYVREGSSYDYTYSYNYGTDSAFSLTVSNLTVSNIDGLGFISTIYEEHESRLNQKIFDIFIYSTLFVIALTSLRGFKE